MSLLHFSMHEEKNPIKFFFPYAYPVSLIQIFGQRTLSSLCDFGTLVQDHLTTYRKVYSGLSVLSHWSIILSLCKYHTDLITIALQHGLKPGIVKSPTLFFFQDFSDYSRSLEMPYEFQDGILYLCKKKNTSGILIGVTFNSEIALGSTNILRISGPPVYEHRITHHLFLSSLIYLSYVLSFLVIQVFHFLG